MNDPYESMTSGLESPPRRFFVVTKSDTDDLSPVPRLIIPSTDGKVRLLGIDDTEPVDYPALAGVPIVGRIRRVYDTGTDITDIVAGV